MVTTPGCILLWMGERLTILVVDDEPSVLLTNSMILRHHGYEVIGVATAREAKVVLEEQRFDMLVCDLALEGSRSGLDVLEFARARYPGIPAVLLTGYATRELGEETERKRITLLSKPIEVKDLMDTISRLARKQSA
jgi:DNA-binding NtrC family response regulator